MKGMKRKQLVREWALDFVIDIVAGIAIAGGIYNFALNANFPVAGFSGIAIILYHLTGLPVGAGTILLNIPVAAFCYKFLGRSFFLKSVKSTLISSLLTDYVAPLFPVYAGSRLLAALCMGTLCGFGYALIFMRGSSTGGLDFITLSIKKLRPHIPLGALTFVSDLCVILLGSIVVFRDVDGLLYGIIVTWMISRMIDHMLYGMDAGKTAFIVTEQGALLSEKIDEFAGRGSTILSGRGSYTGDRKDVIMCACNNKQMYRIKKIVHETDPQAFSIIMESNEVVGEGFKEKINEL